MARVSPAKTDSSSPPMPPTAPTAARQFFRIGALSAGIAVAAGAFGAHALRARIEPRLLEVFETGARYQMYHALALLAVGWLLDRVAEPRRAEASSPDPRAIRAATIAGWAFVAGTVLFSGSLYAMAVTGIRVLGAITPLGGVAFLMGWASLALAASRAR